MKNKIMEAKSFDRLDYIFKLFIVIALSIAGLLMAQDVVVPLAFAVFLSVVMLPLVKWLERKKLNSVLAITIVLSSFTILLFFIGWLIIDQVIALINDLPDIETRITAFLTKLSTVLSNEFSISLSQQTSFLQDSLKTISSYAGDLFLSTTSLLSLLIQIPIYIFLLLIYRDKFKSFFDQLLPNNEDLGWKKELEKVLQGYVVGLSVVTLIIALLNTIGLALLGIEHAIFFGLLSGLLTIIPYVGIFIGAALPALLALVTKDSGWYAVGVIGYFSFVQFLEGNFITPRITGSKVSINALAAIIALVLGGKILGVAGMILAVPAIGVLKILLTHTNHLKPFVLLLEDKKDSTPKKSLKKKKK